MTRQARRIQRGAVALCLTLTAATGCDKFNAMSDPMVGCYASKKTGPVEVRVSKQSDAYKLAMLLDRKWDSASAARPGPAIYAQLFGADSSKIAEGLMAVGAPIGLFRAKPGSRVRGLDSTTDYFVFVLLGGTSAFKVECGPKAQS